MFKQKFFFFCFFLTNKITFELLNRMKKLFCLTRLKKTFQIKIPNKRFIQKNMTEKEKDSLQKTNSILNLLNTKDEKSAKNIFENMKNDYETNPEIFESKLLQNMIKYFLTENQPNEAKNIMDYIKQKNNTEKYNFEMKIDDETIKKYINDNMVEVKTYTIVLNVDHYNQFLLHYLGDEEEFKKIFGEIIFYKLKVNFSTSNIFVRYLLVKANNNRREISEVIKYILTIELLQNNVLFQYNFVLHHLIKIHDFDFFKKVFKRFVKKHEMIFGINTYGALIRFYSKQQKSETALKIYQKVKSMYKETKSEDLKPNDATIYFIISSYKNTNISEELLMVLDKDIREFGIEVTPIILIKLITNFLQYYTIEQTVKYLEIIDIYPTTLKEMIKTRFLIENYLFVKNDLETAQSLMKKMTFQFDHNLFENYQIICSLFIKYYNKTEMKNEGLDFIKSFFSFTKQLKIEYKMQEKLFKEMIKLFKFGSISSSDIYYIFTELENVEGADLGYFYSTILDISLTKLKNEEYQLKDINRYLSVLTISNDKFSIPTNLKIYFYLIRFLLEKMVIEGMKLIKHDEIIKIMQNSDYFPILINIMEKGAFLKDTLIYYVLTNLVYDSIENTLKYYIFIEFKKYPIEEENLPIFHKFYSRLLKRINFNENNRCYICIYNLNDSFYKNDDKIFSVFSKYSKFFNSVQYIKMKHENKFFVKIFLDNPLPIYNTFNNKIIEDNKIIIKFVKKGTKTVMARNISKLNLDQLTLLFKKFGKIKKLKIFHEVAFITYSSKKYAERSLILNHSKHFGSKIYVSY
jgi:hypothetical protein